MASYSELLERGIAAAQAGQTEIARQMLGQVIRQDPKNEEAWLWLSTVVGKEEDRIRCLRQVLAINPNNRHAIGELEALGALPPPETPPPPVGVPIPYETAVARAQAAAQEIISRTLDGTEEAVLSVEWVATLRRKPRQVNLLPIAAALGVLVIVGGLVAGGYLLLSRARRATQLPTVPAAARVSAGPTRTPRPTFTPVPMSAPGQPTYTPSPTLPPYAPHGDVAYGLTPTPAYFATYHPDNPALERAIAQFRAGDYAAVVEAIPQARAAGPDKPDSYFFEGMAHAYLGDLETAADLLQQGLVQAPDMAALHAGLGYVYYHQGEVDAARAENEQAKQLDPRLLMPYLNLAEDYRASGEFEAALAEVEAALAYEPYNVEVLAAQGETYLAAGRPDRAADIGRLAVYIDPTAESAVLLLAKARAALGQYGESAAALEDYLALVDPGNADAWTQLANVRLLQGDEQMALDAYHRALVLTDGAPEIYAARGLLFLQKGDFQAAYDDLDLALRETDDPAAHLGRGQAALALGDARQALSDAEAVLTQTPDQPEANVIKAGALVELGRYDEAVEAADAALELALDDEQKGDALEARGRARYHLEAYAEALSDINAAMQAQETGTRHYYRGLILEASGDAEGAMREYEWGLFWDRVYAYDFAEDAAGRLEALSARPRPTSTPTPRP
jgi:tetratricopeptide (TPR) repeat protein